jgi:hypothetical protein
MDLQNKAIPICAIGMAFNLLLVLTRAVAHFSRPYRLSDYQ